MVFQCEIENCGKLFSCKKTLKEHQRTHTGERPYVCQQCQTTFAQYSSLQKHQRVHDKKKPYVCKFEGCNQAFSQISNLIRHERIHTGEKPYICNICKKKFASGSNLKQHVQVHDNDETRVQYKCYIQECGKGYLYISSLKKHIQISHPAEYDSDIKTNKVDLNDCKEVIQDILNHRYHDDEEEKSQDSHPMTQIEQSQNADLSQSTIKPHGQITLLGKRKYQDEHGHIQQIPQRRKIRKSSKDGEEPPIATLIQNKIKSIPKQEFDLQAYIEPKVLIKSQNEFSKKTLGDIKENFVSSSKIDKNMDKQQQIQQSLLIVKMDHDNNSRSKSPAENFNKHIQGQTAELKIISQDQTHIRSIKKPIIQIQNNQTQQQQPKHNLTPQNSNQDMSMQISQIKNLNPLIIPSIVQQSQISSDMMPQYQMISAQPGLNPTLLYKRLTPDMLISPASHNLKQIVQNKGNDSNTNLSQNISPTIQQAFQPFNQSQLQQQQLEYQLIQQPSNQTQYLHQVPSQFQFQQQQNQVISQIQQPNNYQQIQLLQCQPQQQQQQLQQSAAQQQVSQSQVLAQIQQPVQFQQQQQQISNFLTQQAQISQQPLILSQPSTINANKLSDNDQSHDSKQHFHQSLSKQESDQSIQQPIEIQNTTQSSDPKVQAIKKAQEQSDSISIDLQSHLMNEMQNLTSKLTSAAPEQISTFQLILNDFAQKAANLAQQFSKQIQQELQSQSKPGLQETKDQNKIELNQQNVEQQKVEQCQDTSKQSNLQNYHNEKDTTQAIISYNNQDSLFNQTNGSNEIQENCKQVQRFDHYNNSNSSILSANNQKSDASQSSTKRFKFQAQPLKQSKQTKQLDIQQQQIQQIQQQSQLQQKPSNQLKNDSQNQTDMDFQTQNLRSDSFIQSHDQKSIRDIFESSQKDQDSIKKDQDWFFISQNPHQQSANNFYGNQTPQQPTIQPTIQKSGCASNKQESECCGGSCSTSDQNQNTQQQQYHYQKALREMQKQQQQQQQRNQSEGCCSSSVNSSCACSDMPQVRQLLSGKQSSQQMHQELDEDQEALMVNEMNRNGPDGENFKEPYPLFNKTQSQLLSKNRDSTLLLFSKLPCIKTCMTKISFGGDDKSLQKSDQCKPKGIGFESLEDDFNLQSSTQLGTAACKHICDAQKLCPELLPANCDDYYNKKCGCTVYCKKTLKFIQKFVKDETQVAEIEDLCNIQDQISLMVSQNGIKL